jgi:hypothetical protein
MKTQTRYTVEWLEGEKARRLMRERNGGQDGSIWDCVDESEFTELRCFSSREYAFKWAKENACRDMNGEPCVREQTFAPVTDDRGNDVGDDWDETGYWAYDGKAFVSLSEEVLL